MDRMERNLANRLNIFRDFATVLLLENNWDEAAIAREWTRIASPIRQGIPVGRCTFAVSNERPCVGCGLVVPSKTYGGCRHYHCSQCVRANVQNNLAAGRVVFRCVRPDCRSFMASSVFLNNITEANRDHFHRLVRFNFEASVQPQPDPPLTARFFALTARFFALITPFYQRNRLTIFPLFLMAILMALLILKVIVFSGYVTLSSEFIFKI